MSAVIILLALSALIGFALGTSFSWFAIVISGVVLAAIFCGGTANSRLWRPLGNRNHCCLLDRQSNGLFGWWFSYELAISKTSR
jgi:hypothetical protein